MVCLDMRPKLAFNSHKRKALAVDVFATAELTDPLIAAGGRLKPPALGTCPSGCSLVVLRVRP